MKKRVSRDMVLFLILIPVFFAGAFYISSRMDNKLPSYTIDNKGRDGYSVFYETLRELKEPVERTLKPVENEKTSTVQIVPAGGSFDLNSPKIRSWVEDGGNLLYLTYNGVGFLETTEMPKVLGSLTVYSIGKGEIIIADSSALTNINLIKNKNKAYEIYKEIAGKDKNIYFNESYIFSETVKLSLWDYIPVEIKFIIYQFLLVLGAFFYYKGKRFGPPIPLYEESEREENEYIYSAASLYRIAKCSDLMVDSYYKSLLRELKCSHEDFLNTWQREDLALFDKAEKVYYFIDRGNYEKRFQECINIVSIIEQLRKVVKKRRESYWKTLKKV